MKETVNIEKVEDRAKIVETLLIDVDIWCENRFSDGHRKHLGGSIIGKPCSRELWYNFRWARQENLGEGTSRTAGQILRLFQRGHKEEHAIIEYLEGAGCVFDATPETQIRISDIGGHFGGSLDNIGTLPPSYGINDKILFEFKTSNMAEFNKLKKNGLKNHKPVHYSQMCVYGYKAELRFGLYVCVDKNTDEIYMELIELDWDHGKAMIDKAGMIITAKEAPPKYSMSATNFVCKWCGFKDICHHDAPVEKNCRSCVNSTPAADGVWLCGLAPEGNNVIPDRVIQIGCDSHQGIQ